MKSVQILAILLGAAFTLSGCLVTEPESEASKKRAAVVDVVRILGADKAPIPRAQVTALAGEDVLALLAADDAGMFRVRLLPAATVNVTFSAAGYTSQTHGAKQLPSTITLAGLIEGAAKSVGVLSFLKPVDLICTDAARTMKPQGYRCGDFGEPVMEVAGDGTIWASATCCIGPSPPIWISKDGGVTFKMLEGEGSGTARDAVGIEGDFAIDDAGNVYFFDILAGTSYFTSYTADGKHRHSLAWPYLPLVDRPWVRAGKADQAYVFYNTGGTTAFYASSDGGKTWSPTPGFNVPCGLGIPGQGPTRERMFVAACGGAPKLWITKDAGKTWAAPTTVPMPEIKINPQFGKGTQAFMPPVSDEAGNIYVPFTHYLDEKTQEVAVFLARLNVDGTWSGPWQVSPRGQNTLPWPAASRDGQIAIAYYHADGLRENASKLEWVLHVAASVDASSATPHFQVVQADPEILARGNLGRQLGDFLEADLTPDGRFVVVYGKRTPAGVLNRFVSSDGGLDLSLETFLNGPQPA